MTMMRLRTTKEETFPCLVEDGLISHNETLEKAKILPVRPIQRYPLAKLALALGIILLLHNRTWFWSMLVAPSAIAVNLREDYLDLVIMGLLGGLNHNAILDKNWQSSTNHIQGANCLTRDYEHNKPTNLCIVKWDGYERLTLVREIYKRIHAQNIPGDLVECGVWRGGQTILMRALVKAYGDDNDRKVWVSDSFGGVPNAEQQKAHPDYQLVPEEFQKADGKMWGRKVQQKDLQGTTLLTNILTVERQGVEDNFKRFGLYDEESIRWLPGWFNEALPHAAEQGLKKIAMLRVDGDLYSSTMDVLVNLYPYVSSGGYIIFDDYHIAASKQAIHDFFDKHGLDKTKIIDRRVSGPRIDADDKPEKAMMSFNAYFRKP